MKRFYKKILALTLAVLMVTGCGSTTTQATVTSDTETLENTTIVIGRLIEVAGNQITVQIGEMATTSMGGGMGRTESETSESMPEDMEMSEMPEGMAERTETGEMPEGMTGRGEMAEGEMPEGMAGRGEMAEGEMPEGMTGRGEMAEGEMPEGMTGRGEMVEGEMPEGMTERTGGMGGQMTGEAASDETSAPATQAPATTETTTQPTETTTQTTEAPTANATGEMPDRTSGEMPEGMGERSMGGDMAGGGMGEMGGMTSDSSSTSYSSVEELKDALISSVYSAVVLSDVYETYTIPVGTPIDQYGVETTFLQLTEKSYVSIVLNEAGVIVSMEVLGG